MNKCSIRLGMLVVLLFVVLTSVASGGTIDYTFVPIPLVFPNDTTFQETIGYDLNIPFSGGSNDKIYITFAGILINENLTQTSTVAPVGDYIIEAFLKTFSGETPIPQLTIGKGCTADSNSSCWKSAVGTIALSDLGVLSGMLDVKLNLSLSPGPGSQYILSAAIVVPDPPGSSVPEPSSLLLLGLGILGLGVTFCRKGRS